MTPLDWVIVIGWVVMAAWYRWDKVGWDKEREKLLDRLQAYDPNALAALTSREYATAEVKRETVTQPRVWRPEMEAEEDETPELEYFRAKAAAGDAAYLD
jgi:hypothetical protein